MLAVRSNGHKSSDLAKKKLFAATSHMCTVQSRRVSARAHVGASRSRGLWNSQGERICSMLPLGSILLRC
eukprot:4103155-Pleurochrysis_carterae.AAC.2